LKELVLDAQKTGDSKDALRVLDAVRDWIPPVDFARWSRELDNLRAVTALDKAGG
jgi:hypothetical protein